MKSCLRLAGHVVRVYDSLWPKQLFYSEMREGKRKASKPKKRFKDFVKNQIQHIGWRMGKMDWSLWRKLINVGIESFENSRIQYTAYKWSVRKGEQGLAPGP